MFKIGDRVKIIRSREYHSMGVEERLIIHGKIPACGNKGKIVAIIDKYHGEKLYIVNYISDIQGHNGSPTQLGFMGDNLELAEGKLDKLKARLLK